ncbi:MAG: hypothetical protein BWY65_01654 [Firmicutes bacterium ADurb.Bin373]|nr:MAG: hypothetical protein BWY65_01654 [Firmicutes bacterium ADurb.Bin373]
MRGAVDSCLHPHCPQRPLHPAGHVVELEVHGSECDILTHRGHEQLVIRILKHQPDLTPDLTHCLRTQQFTGNAHHPLLGGQDAIQMQGKGCLARAVGPQQRHSLPLGHTESHVPQRHRAVRIRVPDAVQVDHHRAWTIAITAAAAGRTTAGQAAPDDSGTGNWPS